MSLFVALPMRYSFVLIISALMVSGCSSSGSDSSDSLTDDIPLLDNIGADGTDGNATTVVAARVEFSITVPAYQSDSLQVRLSWGTEVFNASWVGDELWSATHDFPTNTEHELVVTFSDDNGGITLGQYENVFKTGVNDSEDYRITADQFNVDQWDNDGDGIGNLAESIAGTNPIVDETSVLEVRDTYIVRSIFPVSEYYEVRIPETRPYFEYSEEFPTTGFYTDRKTHVITIDIDELGTGIISDKYRFAGAANRDITIIEQEASRTKTDDSVIWTGTYKRSNSGSGVSNDISFSIETEVVSQSTYKQTGSIEREETGVTNGVIQSLSYSLIGNVDAETSLCEPTAGSLIDDAKFILTDRPHIVSTIKKEPGDDYWKVSEATPDGEYLGEYFVRTLSTNFYCDFGDLSISTSN